MTGYQRLHSEKVSKVQTSSPGPKLEFHAGQLWSLQPPLHSSTVPPIPRLPRTPRASQLIRLVWRVYDSRFQQPIQNRVVRNVVVHRRSDSQLKEKVNPAVSYSRYEIANCVHRRLHGSLKYNIAIFPPSDRRRVLRRV